MKLLLKSKVIDGYLVSAKDGCLLKPEKWEFGRLLMPSDWQDASHYLQRGWGEHEGVIAVNVYITGRKIRYNSTYGFHVSILLEFVGDGEPSTFTSGILYISPHDGSMQKIDDFAQIG